MTTTQILAKLDRVIELLEQLVGNELITNHSQVNESMTVQQLQPLQSRVSGEPISINLENELGYSTNQSFWIQLNVNHCLVLLTNLKNLMQLMN